MDYLVLIFAYLIGSIPFGYLFTLMLKKTDIRGYGSGNIGATNVMRLLGWRIGILVLLLDAGKGAAAVLLAIHLSGILAIHLTAGLIAILGHSFPVFLGFRGGKGAATGIGVLAVLGGWATPAALLIAGIAIAATRYVSLGSILGALSLPLLFWLFGFEALYIYFGAVAALLVLLRHHANIGRLLKGTESKLGRQAAPREEGEN